MESSEDYELFHYGVKGMRWGVIRENLGSAASSAKGFVKNDPVGRTRNAAKSAQALTKSRRNEYKELKYTQKSMNAKIIAATTGAAVAGKLMKSAIRNTPVGRNFATRHPLASMGAVAVSSLLGGAAGTVAVNEVRRHRANSTN